MLLPVHNAAPTLREALGSLTGQTLRDLEIIVFDDGSTDSSPKIAEEFARQDPRILPVRSPHVGIVEALRIAASHARAPILARMDADDIADPTRFDKQLAYLEEHPRVGLCGALVTHFGDPAGLGLSRYLDWINGLHDPAALERERFVECPIPHPTFMMRREAFDAAGGYQDHGWPEDYDLVLRIHRAGWQLGKVPEPLLQWRHTASRLSMTSPRYAPEQFRAIKRHHLIESVLDSTRPFYQWGAGKVGKPWLREWRDPERGSAERGSGERGSDERSIGKQSSGESSSRPRQSHTPVAVVDINPRKIGKRIHCVPVIPPDDLPGPGRAITLIAVGTPGAREDIRAWFHAHGHHEGRDYHFIA